MPVPSHDSRRPVGTRFALIALLTTSALIAACTPEPAPPPTPPTPAVVQAAPPPATTTTTKPPATTTTTNPPATTTTKPPTTTTTTKATTASARQQVYAWVGGEELWKLAHSQAPSGVNLDLLQSSGIGGAVVSTGLLDGATIPKEVLDMWRGVRNRGMKLHVSTNVASPTAPFGDLFDDAAWANVKQRLQFLAAQAKSANANGLALDLEPYGVSESMWSVTYPGNTRGATATRTKMRERARELAPILASVGPLIIYPSSNASFPGSYNDIVQSAAGNGTDVYANNMFGDFLAGLLDAGVEVTLTDAVFHWGPQAPGRTWETGIAESVRRAVQAFPGLSASVMLWPDNNEGHGVFSPASMRTAFDAATRLSTGPAIMYEHTLVWGGQGYDWPATLAAIKSGIGA